nr:NUDIX domain-containing protein [Nocardioidaceae bacterium]
ALRREVVEETGLDVAVGRLVGTVERTGPDGTTYAINDHECAVHGGELRAGDDASDVGWFSPAELLALDTAPHLVDSLAGWGVLTNPR